MKKEFIIYLIFCTLSGTLWAQTTAKEIIEKSILQFQEAGGIQANFSAKTSLENNEGNKMTGKIYVQKERFKIENDQAISWFNGTTLWSYVIQNNEVNISEPEEEELVQLNPYYLLQKYNDYYNISVKKKVSLKKKWMYHLELSPITKEESSFKFIHLYIEIESFQPYCIQTYLSSGEITTIEISNYQIHQKYTPEFFSFQEEKYPDVEPIDLR